MKKTISALLIAVLLITLAVSPVLGEESFPLTVMALEDELQEYWAEMPGVASVKDLCFNPHSKAEDADFFRLYDEGLSMKEVREKGVIASFEPGETLLKDLDTLPPIFGNILKNYLITEDGRMWGVRGMIHVKTPLFWIPDAWNASPFADRTPPSSFTEMLDFLEVYLATPHEGFELMYNFGEKNYTERTIVLMLLDSWFYQSVHASEPARYNSPELVALLERTDRIIRELKKQEPVKKKDQKDLRPLFTDLDNGKDFLSRDPYTWDNMIPYRIDPGQDPLIYVESRVICVQKDSPFASRASDFLERVITLEEEEGDLQYSHPDQLDVDAFNRKYFPEIEDGFLSQEMVDSTLRINAVPVFNVGLGDYGEDVAFGSLLKEFLSGKLSPQKFIDKLEKNRAEE